MSEITDAQARGKQFLLTQRGGRVDLIDVGQKVSVKDAACQKPEQRHQIYDVRQVVGQGADAFVSLLAPDGTLAEWFRMDQLQPASVSPHGPQPIQTALPIGKPFKGNKVSRTQHTAIGRPPVATVQAGDVGSADLISLATQLATLRGLPYADAVRVASDANATAVTSYRVSMDSGPRSRGEAAAPVPASMPAERTVRQPEADRLINLARTIEKTRGMSYRDALIAVSRDVPQASEAYQRAMNSGLRDRGAPDVLSLADRAAAQQDEQAFQTASRVLVARALVLAKDRHLPLSDAMSLACEENPTQTQAYISGRNRGRHE